MTYFNHGSFIDLAIIILPLFIHFTVCETNIANQFFDFWSLFLDFNVVENVFKKVYQRVYLSSSNPWGYSYWPVREGRWEVPRLKIVLLFLLKHFSATLLCYERTIRLFNAPFTKICWFPKCVTKEQVGVVCDDWLQVSLWGTVPIISPPGSICF